MLITLSVWSRTIKLLTSSSCGLIQILPTIFKREFNPPCQRELTFIRSVFLTKINLLQWIFAGDLITLKLN